MSKETSEKKGIEYLESLPDGCLFRWAGFNWHKCTSSSGTRWSTDIDYFFRDRGDSEVCTGGLEGPILRGLGFKDTDALIATASEDTIEVLYPKPEPEPEPEPEPPEGMVEIPRPDAVTSDMKISVQEGATVRYQHYMDTDTFANLPPNTKFYDKIENVLPPAPEGTVWYRVQEGDVWMEGDRPWNGVEWYSDGVDYSIGSAIINRTLHGYICRKPCKWTQTSSKGEFVYWQCECGQQCGYETRPDICPDCNRPIIEAKPEPKLRYVKIVKAELDIPEHPFPACDLPFQKKALADIGLQFLGWAVEEGGDIYDMPSPVIYKCTDAHVSSASVEDYEKGLAETLHCTFAVFKEVK